MKYPKYFTSQEAKEAFQNDCYRLALSFLFNTDATEDEIENLAKAIENVVVRHSKPPPPFGE